MSSNFLSIFSVQSYIVDDKKRMNSFGSIAKHQHVNKGKKRKQVNKGPVSKVLSWNPGISIRACLGPWIHKEFDLHVTRFIR